MIYAKTMTNYIWIQLLMITQSNGIMYWTYDRITYMDSTVTGDYVCECMRCNIFQQNDSGDGCMKREKWGEREKEQDTWEKILKYWTIGFVFFCCLPQIMSTFLKPSELINCNRKHKSNLVWKSFNKLKQKKESREKKRFSIRQNIVCVKRNAFFPFFLLKFNLNINTLLIFHWYYVFGDGMSTKLWQETKRFLQYIFNGKFL